MKTDRLCTPYNVSRMPDDKLDKHHNFCARKNGVERVSLLPSNRRTLHTRKEDKN